MLIKLRELTMIKTKKWSFLLKSPKVSTRISYIIVFVLLFYYPAAAQENSCPRIPPHAREKITSDMLRWAREGQFTGCRQGGAPNIDCDLIQTFVMNARVSPIYLRMRWTALVSCFPELGPVKTINEQAILKNAGLEKSKQATIEAAKQEQQGKDNDPKHILTRTYYEYISIRKCFDKRDGYISVNISAVEMERAKRTAKGIEEAISKNEPGIDKDAAWKSASSDSDEWKTETDKAELTLLEQYNSQLEAVDLSDRNRCQNLLHSLEKRLEKIAPKANNVKKDF